MMQNQYQIFLRVVELTESRFINQPGLVQKIEQSKEIQLLLSKKDEYIFIKSENNEKVF